MWSQDPTTVVALTVGTIIVVMLAMIVGFGKRYCKVGPNQALIISGAGRVHRTEDGEVHRCGFRIVQGGGTFVWPIIEQAEVLSLEVMNVPLCVPVGISCQAVRPVVDGTANVKVSGEAGAIAKAAECFLGKSQDEIVQIVGQLIAKHVRDTMGKLSIEEMGENLEVVVQQIQEAALDDVAAMGLEILSLTISDIRPSEGHDEIRNAQ
jgi:flotillin